MGAAELATGGFAFMSARSFSTFFKRSWSSRPWQAKRSTERISARRIVSSYTWPRRERMAMSESTWRKAVFFWLVLLSIAAGFTGVTVDIIIKGHDAEN